MKDNWTWLKEIQTSIFCELETKRYTELRLKKSANIIPNTSEKKNYLISIRNMTYENNMKCNLKHTPTVTQDHSALFNQTSFFLMSKYDMIII